MPLSSLNVLDFSTLLPGPFASMTLADLGANVVRVESPHRPDMVRFMPPFDDDGVSGWHGALNRGKRSLALDLKKPEAVEIVKKLILTYDIVLEQFRPGVMDRLGVGYEALRAINPRLIYCSITGYGQTGPYRHRAGHDNNYLALAGMMSHSGRRDQGPPPLGMQVADIGGGAMGALVGLLTAVIHRSQTGEGQAVDISMFDMAVAWQTHTISAYLVGDRAPQRETELLNGGGFYDYYETKDGRYLSVGSLEPKFWTGLCYAIARPDLIERGFVRELAAQQALKQELRAAFAARTFAEWTAVFADLDLCVEPVLTVPEMLEHPQTAARGIIVDLDTPSGGVQRQVGSPYKFGGKRPSSAHIGAAVGAHTDQVLAEIGYSQREIGLLRRTAVFG